MKKIFSSFIMLILGVFLVGCVGNVPQTSKEPTSGTYKFDGVKMDFIQKHQPTKVKYQDKSVVETKLNDEIKKKMFEKNLLNENSQDKIDIELNYRREFVGEATFAKSDSIGNIFFKYDIKVLRGDKILRNISQNREMRYNPGFLGNLKTIAGANRSDDFENGAIVEIANELVEQIEKIK